jgi:hypothetical protein
MIIERLANTRIQPTQAFLAALAGVLLGLFAPGLVGAVVLGAMVLLLVAMATVTWRTLRPGAVAVRLVLIAGLALVAVLKLIWQ